VQNRAWDHFRKYQFIISPNVDEELQIVKGKSRRKQDLSMLSLVKGLV
jgi:hypothetical protein